MRAGRRPPAAPRASRVARARAARACRRRPGPAPMTRAASARVPRVWSDQRGARRPAAHPNQQRSRAATSTAGLPRSRTAAALPAPSGRARRRPRRTAAGSGRHVREYPWRRRPGRRRRGAEDGVLHCLDRDRHPGAPSAAPPARGRPGVTAPEGRAQLRLVGEVETDAAQFGTVPVPRRGRLQRHRPAQPAGRDRRVGRGHRNGSGRPRCRRCLFSVSTSASNRSRPRSRAAAARCSRRMTCSPRP